MGRDWTISDCVVEALEDWLKKPENQALIGKYRLKVEAAREF